MKYSKMSSFVNLLKKMNYKHCNVQMLEYQCVEIYGDTLMASDFTDEVTMSDSSVNVQEKFFVRVKSFIDAFKDIPKNSNVNVTRKGFTYSENGLLMTETEACVPYIIIENTKDHSIRKMENHFETTICALNVKIMEQLNLFTADEKEQRKALEGVFVDYENKMLVATNGRCMGYIPYKSDVNTHIPNLNIIIPSRIIDRLVSFKTEKVLLSVCKSEVNDAGTTVFDTGIITDVNTDTTIKFPMQSEKYPDYRNVLPTGYGEKKFPIKFWKRNAGVYLFHNGKVVEESSSLSMDSGYHGPSFRMHSDLIGIIIALKSGTNIQIKEESDHLENHPILCIMDNGLNTIFYAIHLEKYTK